MRSQLVVAALAFGLVVSAVPEDVDARPRPARKSKTQFEANKGFGLGIMLGSPSGLSGKYYIGTSTAIDFGLGSYYGRGRDGYRDSFGIHADFLWHPFVLADPEPFWLPLYVGVGARFLDHEGRDDNTHVGVRVPVGIAMDFNNVPLDIFLEVAFVFDIIRDDDRHNRTDLHQSLGIRYYFN
jgi:hypothetical protein